MYKRCRTFPSEYQVEYTKKKFAKREPYIPIQQWDDDGEKEKSRKFDENTEKLLMKFILEGLQSIYQLHYKDRSTEQEKEEIDLGNELVIYLNNLYSDGKAEKPERLLYTSTRVFGYSSSQDLSIPLSNYQDTYGRTGGHVILKNIRKILSTKRRQVIRSKLQANAERQPVIVVPDKFKSFSNKNE